MKLRKLFTWINDALRPAHVEGHMVGARSVDNVDAATAATSGIAGVPGGYSPGSAPPNWVRSQQDDRPRH